MNRIKFLREEKNMLQDDLAKILGVTQKTISNYENETRDIPTEYLKKLSNYFDVSTDYLLGKSNIRNYSDINFSKEDIEFAKKIKPLSEEHKIILKKFIDTLNEEK